MPYLNNHKQYRKRLLSPSPNSEGPLDELLAKAATKAAAPKRKSVLAINRISLVSDSGPEAAAKIYKISLTILMKCLIKGVAGYQKTLGKAIPMLTTGTQERVFVRTRKL